MGSKRVIFRRGTPALYRPLVFPSYDLPIPRQVLTFGEFIHAFLLYEMSLDISNPCDNLLSVFPKKSVPAATRGEKKPTARPKKRFYSYILPIKLTVFFFFLQSLCFLPIFTLNEESQCVFTFGIFLKENPIVHTLIIFFDSIFSVGKYVSAKKITKENKNAEVRTS